MTNYRQTMSQALEYMHFVKETNVLERELTDKELKRREEIAKELDDQEFKDRYGKDWMQVKMGTATKMAKAEDLDEKADVSLKKKAEKSGISASILKQVYNRGVAAWRTGHRPGTTPEQWGHARVNSFISKSSGTWGGADKDLAAKAKGQKEEVELDENNLDKMRKAAGGAKQTLKMKDGSIGMDSFTASAIMQIYDKVNDKNKKTIENMMKNGKKADIMKLAKFAMSKVNAEYVPEEFEEEFELDERMKLPRQLIDTNKEVMLVKKNKVIVVDKKDQDKYMKQGWILAEEVELDEGKMQDVWQKKNAKSLSVGPFELLRGKSGVHTIKRSGKVIGDFSYDSDADNFVANIKGMKGQWTGNDIDSLFTHLQKVHKEEVELDEKRDMSAPPVSAKVIEDDGFRLVMKFKDGTTEALPSIGRPSMQNLKGIVDKNILKNPKRKAWVPVVSAAMKKGPVKEEVEIEEASAAADARRAMRRDPDMKQRAFSKDDSATDDDKKAASKNIMVQMRKAQSLRGKFDVEFQDGKKVKIPAKMAIAVQQKYNSMRKPADKEKFQAKIAKSYKDMLTALKEGFASDAQRKAAFASGYKEKGKKNKKESVLDRIDKKLKEIKNG